MEWVNLETMDLYFDRLGSECFKRGLYHRQEQVDEIKESLKEILNEIQESRIIEGE